MTPTQRILSQIASAQKLSEGATPGEWLFSEHPPAAFHDHVESAGSGWLWTPMECKCSPKHASAAREVPYSHADSQFIAASRTLIPRLARQLEEAVKALEEQVRYGKFLEMPGVAEGPLVALSRIEQIGASVEGK